MNPKPESTPSDDERRLSTLVTKQHVTLGGLSEAERRCALALAWASVPRPGVLSEREVNEALRACLGTSGAFLGTDHVELRRWLVDMGWLARDGFGREYRAVAAADAPAAALALRLSGLDLPAWVAGHLALHEARRAERRSAWLIRQGRQQAHPA